MKYNHWLFISQNVMETLNRLRKNKEDYDIELMINGSTICAHRKILSANSEYFRGMLKGNYKESGQSSIDMSCTFPDTKVLELIIEYFYTGTLEISDDNYEDILNCACHLLVENVMRHCESFLLQNLAEYNCLFMWALAEKHMLENLRKLCRRIAECRFHDLLRLVIDTLEISDEFLKDMLANKEIIQHLPLHDLVDFLQKWADFDEENRTPKLRWILSGDVLCCHYPLLSQMLKDESFEIDPLNTLKNTMDPRQLTKSGRPKRTVKNGRRRVEDLDQEVVVIDGKGASVAWVVKEMRWVKLPRYPEPELGGRIKGYSTIGYLNPSERSAKLVMKENSLPGEYYLFDVATKSIQKLPRVDRIGNGKYMNLKVFCVRNVIFYSVIDASSMPWQEKLTCTWKLFRVKASDWSLDKIGKENEVADRNIMCDVQLPVNIAGLGAGRDRITQQIVCKSGSAYVVVQAKFRSEDRGQNEFLNRGRIKMVMFEITQGKNTTVRMLKQELISNDGLKMNHYHVVSGPDGFQKLSVSRHSPELLGSVVEIESVASFQGKKVADTALDGHFIAIDIPLDFASGFKGAAMTAYSGTESKVFQARFICPLVNEFWLFDVEEKKWNSMKPPPIEVNNANSRMHVVLIPQSFLAKLEPALYSLPNGDKRSMFQGKYYFGNSSYVNQLETYTSFSGERIDRLGLRQDKFDVSDYSPEEREWNVWNAFDFDDFNNLEDDDDSDEEEDDPEMILPLLQYFL